MVITANDILDAGLLANGKMPDVYWEMGLTGSEMRIMHYIYSNCIRLYMTIDVYPKGTDGSPRFWRDKESMADDCGVSYPTFRKSVRHLAELGLTTSMEDEESFDAYCVGISSAFLATENYFRSHSSLYKNYKTFLSVLYDNSTVVLITKELYSSVLLRNTEGSRQHESYGNHPSAIEVPMENSSTAYGNGYVSPQVNVEINPQETKQQDASPQLNVENTPETTPQETTHQETSSQETPTGVDIDYETTPQETISQETTPNVSPNGETTPQVIIPQASTAHETTHRVTRVPIIPERKPILRFPVSAVVKSAKAQLKMLESVKTPYDRHVLDMVGYYEYKCRQAISSTGFRALGRDFRHHKNWKQFTRVYDMCTENGWDYRIYIDSQFDRLQWFHRPQKYPYPNQMSSEAAQRYYSRYLEDYAEKNSVDGTARPKATPQVSVSQQVADAVLVDVESISKYISVASRRRSNRGLDATQVKILYLSEHWMGLSPYYLASIPWFVPYLSQFGDEPAIASLRDTVSSIQGNRSLMSTVDTVVGRLEGQMGIPKTPDVS